MKNITDAYRNYLYSYREQKFIKKMMKYWHSTEIIVREAEHEIRLPVIIYDLVAAKLEKNDKIIERLKSLDIKTHLYPSISDYVTRDVSLEDKKAYLEYMSMIIPNYKDELAISFLNFFVSDNILYDPEQDVEAEIKSIALAMLADPHQKIIYKEALDLIPENYSNMLGIKLSYLNMRCKNWRDIISITFEHDTIKDMGLNAFIDRTIPRKFKL